MHMIKILIFLFVFYFSSQLYAQKQHWYKGNTHTHTKFSDGDTPIEEVVRWYHDNGYNFLVITDHNKTILPKDYVNMDSYRSDFMLIPGNEISIGNLHYTALGVKNSISGSEIMKEVSNGKLKEFPLSDTINSKIYNSQIQINGILREGGMPILNHPNFASGISEQEMSNLQGVHHIELYNAHPRCANFGKAGHIEIEKKWDFMLTRGLKIYGIGADDTHNLQKWSASNANPGRAWIMVNSPSLIEDDLLKTIQKGEFYTSTGVEFKSYQFIGGKFSVKIETDKTIQNIKNGIGDFSSSNQGIPGYKIEVIGEGGKILHVTTKTKLRYKPQKYGKYVRIKLTYCIKKGDIYRTYYAWGQPAFAKLNL